MKKLFVCLSLGLSISSAMASFHGGEGIGNGKIKRGGGNDPTSGGVTGGGGFCLWGGDGSGGGKICGGEGSGSRSLLGGDSGGYKNKYQGCNK